MYEIVSVASAGTLRAKLPSRSVTVPLLVPFCITVAPITVSPVWSVTTPCTLMSCASKLKGISIAKSPSAKLFLRSWLVLLIQ